MLFCVLFVDVMETEGGVLALYVRDLATHIGAPLLGRAFPDGLCRIMEELLAAVPNFLTSLDDDV